MIETTEKKFKEIVSSTIKKTTYDAFIEPTRILSIENDIIKLQVPSKFHYEYIKGQFRKLILETLKNILEKEDLKIDFVIEPQPESFDKKETVDDYILEKPILSLSSDKKNTVESYSKTELLPKYTFENFVTGDGNEIAFASAQQVAFSPKNTPYNPLLIYGGVGLGKTHLVQAIGNHVFNENPNIKVLYISSDKFVYNIVNAIKNKTIDAYKDELRKMNVIIIDDIQFFARREKSQEELFHVFNHIYLNQGVIILTSDFHPREIHNLDERLRSRFSMGLICDIRPPDLETRAAIVQLKAEELGFRIDKDVVMYIANNINTNVRELEGAVKKLHMHHSIFADQTIELSKAKDILKGFITAKKSALNIDKVQDIVAEYFNIKKDLLLQKNRTQQVADARGMAMYICTERLNVTTQSIGAHFGGRNHSTVSHASKKIHDKIFVEKNSEVIRQYEEIITKINLLTH